MEESNEPATEPLPVEGKPERKSEFIGAGAAVQLLGVVVFLLSFALGIVGAAIGFIAMIMLLLIGSRMSVHWVCGNCKNRIDSKKVTICPACHARLSHNWWHD